MRVVGCLCALLLVACAGAPPPTAQYLLPDTAPEGSARVDPPVWIGLGRVEVAAYLDQSGLVVETETLQVRPARYHRWAEPLNDGLRRFLRAEISAALGYPIGADATREHRWDYTVNVSVDRLHGRLSGEAVLVARWWIESAAGKPEPASFRFSASEALPREGYPGLVDAEIALLRELADAIAGALREETGS